MSNLSTARQVLTVMRDMRDMFPRENRSRGVDARAVNTCGASVGKHGEHVVV